MSTAVATLTERKTFIEKALNDRIETISELLPEEKRGQAGRLVKVALLYFTRDTKLHEVTPLSFIQCVFDSASTGIPLDGRLGHAVAFNCKVKTDRGDVWEKRVKFMPDFKGIVAVARRTRQIADARTRVVYEKDHFEHGMRGPEVVCNHTPAEGDRGVMKGALCLLTFHDKPWTYEYMTKAEIDKVRASSKAKDDGPWVDWFDEMARKTVLKRALKTYCDDPQLIEVIRADDDWHVGTETARSPRVQRSSFTTLKRPESTAALVGAVVDQQDQLAIAQEQAHGETHAPSTPRSQRRAAEEAADVDHAPQSPPDAADEGDYDKDGGDQSAIAEWESAIAEAYTAVDLDDMAEKLPKDNRLAEDDVLGLIAKIGKRKKALKTSGKPDGELFAKNKQMGQ